MAKTNIGVSTWSLQQLSFTQGATIERMIEDVADMGADGIDICEEYIPCHPQPDIVKIRGLRRLIKERGLRIGANWFCTEIGKAIRASNEPFVLEAFKKNILIACEMGAEYICVPLLFDADMAYEKRRDIYLGFFEKILPFAEECGMPIAHECPRQGTTRFSLDIARYFSSKYYTVCPDLEAWRFDMPDLPLGPHCEEVNASKAVPEPMSLFRECLPYAPYIHFKLLSLDANGDEPHFPIPDIMREIQNSPLNHYLCIEYEGWIPDIHPDRDALAETKRCVELIRRYAILQSKLLYN